MKIVHRLVPGMLAGSLLLGAATGVLAAKGHAKPAGTYAHAYGLVSNLSASGFTLSRPATAKHAATSIQVSLATVTRERALKGTTGPLANGEYALAIGTKSASGLSALRIVYSAKPFHANRHLARGAVQSFSNGQLVITTKAGKQLTFSVTVQTKYRVNGKLAAAAPALSQGEQVRVRYHVDKTSQALIANVIAIKSA